MSLSVPRHRCRAAACLVAIALTVLPCAADETAPRFSLEIETAVSPGDYLPTDAETRWTYVIEDTVPLDGEAAPLRVTSRQRVTLESTRPVGPGFVWQRRSEIEGIEIEPADASESEAAASLRARASQRTASSYFAMDGYVWELSRAHRVSCHLDPLCRANETPWLFVGLDEHVRWSNPAREARDLQTRLDGQDEAFGTEPRPRHYWAVEGRERLKVGDLGELDTHRIVYRDASGERTLWVAPSVGVVQERTRHRSGAESVRRLVALEPRPPRR